jgi:hypothetical protein
MRKEPVVYAALVVVALGAAFQTWVQANRTTQPQTGVPIWRDNAERVREVSYGAQGKQLHITVRDPGTDTAYLWATVDTSAFVVQQDAGKRLLHSMASLHALRDLGAVDAPKRHEYGLDTATTHLVVRFQGRSHDLLVGGAAFMTGDRYALDSANGRVYVVSHETLEPLMYATGMLPERRLHAFRAQDIADVTVRSAARSRAMHRSGGAPGLATWTPPDAPQQPDTGFARVMERLADLGVQNYAPRVDPATLTLLLRADYRAADGRSLGFLEMYCAPDSGAALQYYLRTELTRVLVHTYQGPAENVAHDLAQLFGGGAASEAR